MQSYQRSLGIVTDGDEELVDKSKVIGVFGRKSGKLEPELDGKDAS